MIAILWRTLLCHLALILSVRIMGKREVGQLEPSEFVVSMMMADIATIPVAEPDRSVLSGILPIVLIVGVELLLSWLSSRNTGIRRLLCGKPVILIRDGKIQQRDLRRCRISADELAGQLRLKDVMDLTTVQYAILETGGNLSVFLYPTCQPPTAKDQGIRVKKQSIPVTIIEDGRLLSCNLPLAGKDEDWVRRVLQSKNGRLKDTFLLTVDQQDHILWIPKE
jgi:uncharacterized membrane protein YcaP (DUF421 family)